MDEKNIRLDLGMCMRGESEYRMKNTNRLDEKISEIIVEIYNCGYKGWTYYKEDHFGKFKQVISDEKRELIEEIIYHFETMMFDDTGEDKLKNIMDFRKTQSDYLNSLKEDPKDKVK